MGTPTSGSRRGHARVALASGLCSFLAASVALALALETVRPHWRDPEFGHRLPLIRDHREPVVLVIGTSRTQNAIAPAAVTASGPDRPKLFNFGQSAATPLKELLTLHRVLGAGIRPAAVVVEVFPPSLGGDAPAEDEFRDRETRLSRTDVRHMAPFCGTPDALLAAWCAARVVPWYAQRQVLMSHWAARWQPWRHRIDFQWEAIEPDGFQPVVALAPDRRDSLTALALREYAGAFAGFRPGPSSVRALRELVTVCRTNQIPVAFFVPPISPAFRTAFAPGVLDRSERFLTHLGQELGVPVFPAPVDMTEDEFMDGHHLFKHGAERYTRWLADAHLNRWLAGHALRPSGRP